MTLRELLLLIALVMSFIISNQCSSIDSSVSNNVGASSLDLFQKSWQTYKSVVSSDHMEHSSMTMRIKEIIDDWMHSDSIPKRDISISDLGCGDLALLGPVYRSLPLKTFCGVDMSLPALSLAKIAFENPSRRMEKLSSDPSSEERSTGESSEVLPGEDNDDNGDNGDVLAAPVVSTSWANDDILNWASNSRQNDLNTRQTEQIQSIDGTSPSFIPSISSTSPSGYSDKYDIIICAFSVHHLNDNDKIKFLKAIVKNKLNKNGIILMADIFRIENEDRDGYISRFGSHIEEKWNTISKQEKIDVLSHVRGNDYPASLPQFLSEIAPECGLSCDVMWSDTGNFEKLVLLKPI